MAGDTDPCPDDPTTTTTTVPGDPGATTTVTGDDGARHDGARGLRAHHHRPNHDARRHDDHDARRHHATTTTIVADTTTTTTTTTVPGAPTTPPATAPAAPADPSPTAPASAPPTLPPAIPIPPPAAEPPPIGEPVKPAIADPVADPLADAATLASTRLHLWQDALAAVAATQVEADAAQAEAATIAEHIAAATTELASLPEPAAEPETTDEPAAVPAGLVDVSALLAGDDSDAAKIEEVVERRRVLTNEIAVAEAEQRTVAARLDELGARMIEDRVVARAAELGHDSARGVLAAMTAARIQIDQGSELDKVWSTTDPRRLEVLYTALRQVGDPYVFATSGPERFDCSGLTMYAWQTVGVRLAHYSFTQRGQTPAADETALEPGDLVFNLRANGGHVMLYLGVENGIVHAPGTGKRVEVSRWRKATGFGSPLAPVDAATVDAGTLATKPLLDAPVAVAGAPAVRSVTVANSAPSTSAGLATDAGDRSTPAAPTSTTPPATWVGGVPEGARMVDAPDAGLYDGTGALYGVDPALLAGQGPGARRGPRRRRSRRGSGRRGDPGATGPTTVVPPTEAAPDGPLALRPDLAARLGVDRARSRRCRRRRGPLPGRRRAAPRRPRDGPRRARPRRRRGGVTGAAGPRPGPGPARRHAARRPGVAAAAPAAPERPGHHVRRGRAPARPADADGGGAAPPGRLTPGRSYTRGTPNRLVPA